MPFLKKERKIIYTRKNDEQVYDELRKQDRKEERLSNSNMSKTFLVP